MSLSLTAVSTLSVFLGTSQLSLGLVRLDADFDGRLRQLLLHFGLGVGVVDHAVFQGIAQLQERLLVIGFIAHGKGGAQQADADDIARIAHDRVKNLAVAAAGNHRGARGSRWECDRRKSRR